MKNRKQIKTDFILTGTNNIVSLMKINLLGEDSNYDLISADNGIDLLYILNTYIETNKNIKLIIINPTLPKLDLAKLIYTLNTKQINIPLIVISDTEIDLSDLNYPELKLISNTNIVNKLTKIIETINI